jgi:hypothetical protein
VYQLRSPYLARPGRQTYLQVFDPLFLDLDLLQGLGVDNILGTFGCEIDWLVKAGSPLSLAFRASLSIRLLDRLGIGWYGRWFWSLERSLGKRTDHMHKLEDHLSAILNGQRRMRRATSSSRYYSP